MSNFSSQFINDAANFEVHIQSKMDVAKKGILPLKKKYETKFRDQYEHGFLIECLVPVFFFYVFGTFNLNWMPVQNLIIVWVTILLGYSTVQNVFDATLFWTVGVLYQVYELYAIGSPLRAIHFATLMLTMELVPRVFAKQLSVSELFIFASINAYYTHFCMESVLRKDDLNAFLPGCNISNILCFAPWLVLNFSGLLAYFFRLAGMRASVATSAMALALGVVGSLVVISPFNTFEILEQFVKEVILVDLPLIFYMFLILVMGLVAIVNLMNDLPNY